jgi:ribosomal protein S18 acetylase RimI-like enzyme
MEITYRKIEDSDLPFLKEVYKSTRAAEMQLVDWPQEEIERFINQQFESQHSYYLQVYHEATFEIIYVGNEPVGRLYLWESDRQIRIVDISLLPEFRNQGIGSSILNMLMGKSDFSSKVLSIHVEVYNHALSLYQRLGFEQKDQTGVYFYMERNPINDNSINLTHQI